MKKFLSLVLALVMVLSLGVTAGAVDFTDEAAITKTEAVGVLAGLGIINGYEAADGTFSFAPNGNITRGAAAKIICMIKLGTKVAGILSCEADPFKDVAKDSTFAPYIAYCVNEGIVGGYTDGTYKPGNPVTGYAFTKMLLNALGIKGDYEGANYGVNVALAADAAGLFKGMDADTVYGANAIREDACQLAFNALNYSASGKTTKYEVKDGADTLYSGTDALTALVMKQSSATATLKLVETAEDSLGYKNFKLTKDTTTDDFGRESTVYTNGKDKTKAENVYASFSNNAKLTYTTGTTTGKIWTALGFTKAADQITLNVSVDGGAATEMTVKKGDKAAIGGQGTLVEVYATDDAKVFNVFVVNTYVYQLKAADITKAVAATATADAVPAYVTIANATATDKTFDTAAFKKDDVVLYTQTAGKIVNVVKAASVVGTVTATAGDNSYMRVDGVQYKLAAKNAAKIGTDAGYKYVKDGAEYTYYLDTYGNVIFAVEGKAADVKANYIYVTQFASKAAKTTDVAGGDLFSGTENTTAAAAQYKVVDLATGVVSVKNAGIVKNTAGDYVYADKTGAATETGVATTEKPVLKNGLYEYYELTDGSIVLGDKVTGTDVTVKKNTAAVATGVFANSATKLTVVTLEKDAKTSVVKAATVATTTGIANFPATAKAYAGTIVTKDKNGVASEIVAVVDKAAATEAVNYAIYKAAGEVGADTKQAFYQKGAVVEYAIAKDFADTLEAGKVYDLTITEGKLSAAKPVDALNAGAVTVKAVDASYILVENSLGQSWVIYLDTAGCAAYDKDAKYAAKTVEVDDVIVAIYGDSKDTANKQFKAVDMIIIDND